ncbi:undecaprenyl diphosphate synthase family protein [bacterium]|nr:undecaprenyl diphosphate synthase family protein [bacterium]
MSTENLKNRTKIELNYLFDLYKRITENLYDMMRKNHVNFRFAGDKMQLPSHLVDFINEKESEFVFPDSPKTFVLAVNYG